MGQVDSQPVSWLWPGRIPVGKITIIAGEPGVGKSSVAAHLAAIVSNNLAWPDQQRSRDEQPCEPHLGEKATADSPPPVVFFLASEDAAADTIRPRLDALQANPNRIFVANHGVPLTDISYIDAALTSMACCRLLLIDPLATFLGPLNASRNAAVHAWFARLADVAEYHNTAIVCVTHLSRRTTGPALARVQGCLAFTAAARAIWLITADPNDRSRRLLLPAKNNLGPHATGLAFRLEATPTHPDIAIPIWESDVVEETADSILATPSYSMAAEAQSWLTARLQSGPVATNVLRQQAMEEGLSWRTIERAKANLSIVARRVESKNNAHHWTWTLPGHGIPTDDAVTDRAQADDVPLVDESKHNHRVARPERSGGRG